MHTFFSDLHMGPSENPSSPRACNQSSCPAADSSERKSLSMKSTGAMTLRIKMLLLAVPKHVKTKD